MTLVVGLVGGILAAVAATAVAWPFLTRGTRPVSAGDGPPPSAPPPRTAGPAPIRVAGLAAVVAAAGLLLASTVVDRPAGEQITGGAVPAPQDPISFFEERVAERPDDPAARLDLADAYLEAERPDDAVDQYVAALELDPGLPEAHARLGSILSASGRPEDGLRAVERALELRPGYPEAMYAKGLILAEGLDRPRAAARALRAYLDAAPFGAYRDHARRLLERLDRA